MTDLYKEIYKLKKLLRAGWVKRNLADLGRVESVAEHTFSTCMLALEIINKDKLNLDTEKVLKMLLYHEMGEIKVGDYTPYDDITLEEKYTQEKNAIMEISKETGMPEMLDLWLDFEEQKTKESIFAKKVDKLDAILQAEIYAKEKDDIELIKEFYSTSVDKVSGLEKYITYKSKE